MHKIKLLYLGKKKPKKLSIPDLTMEYVFDDKPQWINAYDANWLMGVNPRMFQKQGEKNEPVVEDAEDIVPKEDLELPPEPEEPDTIKNQEEGDFVCDKCGKAYKVKWAYDRHIASCEGPEE